MTPSQPPSTRRAPPAPPGAPTPGSRALAEAVDAVAMLAGAAGCDAASARAEALALAAAVAESAPRAATDWGRAAGDASTEDFFDAASRGRRWREAPTATLTALAAQRSPHTQAYAEALAEVASAACALGEPTMRVIGNASVAAAAQLSVVRPARAPVDVGAGGGEADGGMVDHQVGAAAAAPGAPDPPAADATTSAVLVAVWPR